MSTYDEMKANLEEARAFLHVNEVILQGLEQDLRNQHSRHYFSRLITAPDVRDTWACECGMTIQWDDMGNMSEIIPMESDEL